jgi:hypothetical protein
LVMYRYQPWRGVNDNTQWRGLVGHVPASHGKPRVVMVHWRHRVGQVARSGLPPLGILRAPPCESGSTTDVTSNVTSELNVGLNVFPSAQVNCSCPPCSAAQPLLRLMTHACQTMAAQCHPRTGRGKHACDPGGGVLALTDSLGASMPAIRSCHRYECSESRHAYTPSRNGPGYRAGRPLSPPTQPRLGWGWAHAQQAWGWHTAVGPVPNITV